MEKLNPFTFEAWVQKIRQSLLFRLTAFFESRFWIEKYAFAIVLITWLYAFPSYPYLLSPEPSYAQNWAGLEVQFQNPFASDLADPNVHSTQARFRLFVPVLGYLTGLPPLFFILTMPILGWVFARLLIRYFRDLSGSDLLAFLSGILVMSSYLGRAFTTDLMGYFDGYAFLFLLFGFISGNSVLVFFAYLVALFVDERSLLSLPFFVVLGYFQADKSEDFFRSVFRRRAPIVPLVGALVVCFGIRLYLKMYLGFQESAFQSNLVGFEVLRDNYQIFPLGWLSALHGWLLLLFLPVYYLWRSGNRMVAGLFLLYTILSLFVCQLVLDVTRSTTYLFPGVVLSLILLIKFESQRFTTRVLWLFGFLSMLLPPLVTIGATVVWQGPVFPKVLKLIGLAQVM